VTDRGARGWCNRGEGQLEGRDDAIEERGDIAGAEEDVIDGEEGLQAVAFTGELLLIGLGGLQVDDVVHGDGDLRGHTLYELNFHFSHALRHITPKTDGAEAVLRGGQRHNGNGVDAGVLQALHEERIAGVLCRVEGDEGLLVLPDPAGGESSTESSLDGADPCSRGFPGRGGAWCSWKGREERDRENRIAGQNADVGRVRGRGP